jgi:hypothetical protein
MATTIDRHTDINRDAEITLARAELLRRAEAQSVKPITSLEVLAGDPEVTADFSVEEFLRQVREDRERSSTKSME